MCIWAWAHAYVRLPSNGRMGGHVHMGMGTCICTAPHEWQDGWRSELATFEDVPIASASIGQVHMHMRMHAHAHTRTRARACACACTQVGLSVPGGG